MNTRTSNELGSMMGIMKRSGCRFPGLEIKNSDPNQGVDSAKFGLAMQTLQDGGAVEVMDRWTGGGGFLPSLSMNASQISDMGRILSNSPVLTEPERELTDTLKRLQECGCQFVAGAASGVHYNPVVSWALAQVLLQSGQKVAVRDGSPARPEPQAQNFWQTVERFYGPGPDQQHFKVTPMTYDKTADPDAVAEPFRLDPDGILALGRVALPMLEAKQKFDEAALQP